MRKGRENMRIGISGHQSRPGIQWDWVREALYVAIKNISPPVIGYSSLAKGADQIFAETILACGGTLITVVPAFDYVQQFSGGDLDRYKSILQKSSLVQLEFPHSNEQAYYAAGKYVVDHIDRLFAVWDGQPAQGLGGTADIVQYGLSQRKLVTHVNPITQKVMDINNG